MAEKEVNIFIRLKDEATDTMKKVDAELKKMGTSISGLGSVAATVGGLAAGAAAGIGAMIKSTADIGDKLDEMSQKTGVSVEALSRLQYAAKFSSIDGDSLGSAFKKLSVNMAEAGAKGDSVANNTFRVLGVAVKDSHGKLLAADEVMLKVSDKFSKMEDGAGKTALAVATFGKAGENMIPFLNEGSAGIARLSKESDELGNTWAGKDASNAAAFNDSLDRLTTASKKGALAFSKDLLPAATDLSNTLTIFLTKNKPLITFFSDATAGALMLANAMMGGRRDDGLALEAEKVKSAWDMIQKAEASGNEQRIKQTRIMYQMRLAAMRTFAKDSKALADATEKESPSEKKTAAPLVGASPAEIAKARSAIMAEIAAINAEISTVSGDAVSALGFQKQKAITENLAKEKEEKVKGVDLHKEYASARHLIQQSFALKERDLLEKQFAERLQIAGGLETQLTALTGTSEQQRFLASDQAYNKNVEALVKAYKTGIIPTVEQYASLIEQADRVHAGERGKIASEEDMKRISAELATSHDIAQLTMDIRLGGLSQLYAVEKQQRDQKLAAELLDADKNRQDKKKIIEKYALLDRKGEQDAQIAKQQRMSELLSNETQIAQLRFDMGMGTQSAIWESEKAQREIRMQEELQTAAQHEGDLDAIKRKYALLDQQADRKRADAKVKQEADTFDRLSSFAANMDKATHGRVRGLFEASKAFAIVKATIDTYGAANAALSAPPGPPWSYAYVAAAMAAGMANVSAIQAQQPPAYAMGGIVDRNTIFRAGEAGPEAIVPLSGGRSIPVDLRGGSNGAGGMQNITIVNVIDPAMFVQDPNTIINVINRDIATNGMTRKTIQQYAAK